MASSGALLLVRAGHGDGRRGGQGDLSDAGDGVMERMTAINLPGHFSSGLSQYGRKSVPEMIALIRDHARHQKETAEAILSASDADFHVATYVGIYVQKRREVLQLGLEQE